MLKQYAGIAILFLSFTHTNKALISNINKHAYK